MGMIPPLWGEWPGWGKARSPSSPSKKATPPRNAPAGALGPRIRKDTARPCGGVGAEERGQGQAIAENLLELSTLCVPVISILVGEGGSGGALALAVADRVWMLQNAVYSVISPEGCASILWKDSSKAAEAAASLRLTAEDAKSLGIVERILSEKELGKKEFYHRIRALLEEELESLAQDSDLVSKRYERFRRIGSSAVCGAKESL